MAFALARTEDLLASYDPFITSMNNQARPLEVASLIGGNPSPLEARAAFPEMVGGADTYYEDFTSGLREFVEAHARVGGTGGRASADPSAVVLGIDWLAEDFVDEGDEQLRVPPPGRKSPRQRIQRKDNINDAEQGINAFIVPT